MKSKSASDSTSHSRSSIFSQLQHPSLRQAIAAQIHSALLAGKLKPGQRITEETTCKALGVSRASVREAFQEMRTLGILTSSRHKTYIHGEFDASEIRDAYLFRGMCEGVVAKDAKRNLRKEGFERLEMYIRRMEEASRKTDLEAFWNADLAFHDLIWQSNDRPHVQRLLQVVTVPYHPYLIALLRKSSARQLSGIARGHRDHLEALRRLNGNTLRRRLEQHYRRLGAMFVALSEDRRSATSRPKRGGSR